MEHSLVFGAIRAITPATETEPASVWVDAIGPLILRDRHGLDGFRRGGRVRVVYHVEPDGALAVDAMLPTFDGVT